MASFLSIFRILKIFICEVFTISRLVLDCVEHCTIDTFQQHFSKLNTKSFYGCFPILVTLEGKIVPKSGSIFRRIFFSDNFYKFAYFQRDKKEWPSRMERLKTARSGLAKIGLFEFFLKDWQNFIVFLKFLQFLSGIRNKIPYFFSLKTVIQSLRVWEPEWISPYLTRKWRIREFWKILRLKFTSNLLFRKASFV